MIMENNINERKKTDEYTVKLFNVENINDVSSENIKETDKRKLLSFMQGILKVCAECDFRELDAYDYFFERLNIVTDEYIGRLDDETKSAYNFFALNFIADTVHAYLKINKNRNELANILSGEIYYRIAKELNSQGVLTQSELADKLEMSTQCLSNHLKKISNSNVFIKYKIPENRKQTFYALSADCKKFINGEEGKKLKAFKTENKYRKSPVGEKFDAVYAIKHKIISVFGKDDDSYFSQSVFQRRRTDVHEPYRMTEPAEDNQRKRVCENLKGGRYGSNS